MNTRTIALLVSLCTSMAQLHAQPSGNPLDPPALPGGSNPLDPASSIPAHSAAPSWLKSGTRVTFYSASATIPGVREQLVQNYAGEWVDPQTGRAFTSQSVPSASGHGYCQVNIAFADNQAVALDIRNYGVDLTSGQITSLGSFGTITNIAGGDFWTHPARLAEMQNINTASLKVTRMNYPMDGRTYKALRVQSYSAQGYIQHTWDTETGLLLSSGSSTQGAAVGTIDAQGRVSPGSGSTTLATMKLLGVRDTKLPWNDDQFPDWLLKTRMLHFKGGKTTEVAGSGTATEPMSATMQITRSAAGWIFATVSIKAQMLGIGAQEAKMDRAFGVACTGSIWISPRVLSQLQRGQVIDEDPFLKSKMSVNGMDGQRISFVDAGPSESSEYIYDLQSGMLVSIDLSQQNGLGKTRTVLQFQGRE